MHQSWCINGCIRFLLVDTERIQIRNINERGRILKYIFYSCSNKGDLVLGIERSLNIF